MDETPTWEIMADGAIAAIGTKELMAIGEPRRGEWDRNLYSLDLEITGRRPQLTTAGVMLLCGRERDFEVEDGLLPLFRERISQEVPEDILKAVGGLDEVMDGLEWQTRFGDPLFGIGSSYRDSLIHRVIPASPDQIWETLVRTDHYPDWNPLIVEMSGILQVDAELRFSLDILRDGGVDFTGSCVAFEEPGILHLKGTSIKRGLLPNLLGGFHEEIQLRFEIRDRGDGSSRLIVRALLLAGSGYTFSTELQSRLRRRMSAMAEELAERLGEKG